MTVVLVALFGVGPIMVFVHYFRDGVNGAVSGRLSAASVEQDVGRAMTERLGEAVTINCPDGDPPLQRGRISDCVATDRTGQARIVRITQDDDQGHYRWEVTDQRPS